MRLKVIILLALLGQGFVYGQVLSYRQQIWSKANKYGIDPYLMLAIVEAESKGNPDAISEKDCRGLAQLNIYTARMYDPYLIRADLHGAGTNLEIAAKHIRDLREQVRYRFPKANRDRRVVLIAAAYNAGISAVESYKGVPNYGETKRYVKKVLRYYLKFRGEKR